MPPAILCKNSLVVCCLGLLAAAGCEGAPPDKVDGSICTPARETVSIATSSVRLGASAFYPEERPVRTVEVGAFDIDATEVTNRQFAEFVAATGYKTRAERGYPEDDYAALPAALRAPGSVVFVAPMSDANMNPANWWKFVGGANWRAPEGPGTSIDEKDQYPVVHVTYEDATAYAAWKNRRLPTEAEWEAAARGGLQGADYSWGETPPGKLKSPPANVWQGLFPFVNQETDGYNGAAPVGCFEPNGFGLYDMTGNVWEWTADPYFPDRGAIDDPTAPVAGFDPRQPGVAVGVLKGGSYLCADNYCVRFRPAARQAQELNLGASHIGFRTAGD